MTTEQKTLGERVEKLLSWLRETEAQMDGGVTGMEGTDKTKGDQSHAQLTQQLQLCKVSYCNSEGKPLR